MTKKKPPHRLAAALFRIFPGHQGDAPAVKIQTLHISLMMEDGMVEFLQDYDALCP
jgi:hypothetical protein